MTRPILATVVAGAMLVAACGYDDTSRYEQTWTTPYEQTTCTEWNGEMMGNQQFAMAADLLTAARLNDDENAAFPSEELFEQMRSGIQALCDAEVGLPAGERRIPALALLVYGHDRVTFAP